MRLTLEFCAGAMGARVRGDAGGAAEGASTDSRTLAPGALFFALRGPTHDGHDHVAAAHERGAAAVVVEREVACAGTQLIVADTLAALQSLARAAREKWGEASTRRVIGVTGSAGKTTTKEAIAAALGTHFRTGKTTGNFNNHIGVPLSVLNLADDAEAAVLEIGMNHAGEIRALCAIARPQIGVVTNVGTAHIEAFDSRAAVARAKRELIEALPKDGVAVLNADDEQVRRFAEFYRGRTIFYGTSDAAEVRGHGMRYHESGCEFTLAGVGRYECGLPGRGGLMAALAAIATARAVGVSAGEVRAAIAGLRAPKMRLQRMERGGIAIWDDCYNSNPEAVEMTLDLLAGTPAQRRIAVLGEMLELGRWSDELHREVGRYAVQCGVAVLIGIRGAAREMVAAASAAGMEPGAALYFDDARAAGLHLKSIARAGDCILFKGSRGTRVELALEAYLE